MTNPKLVEWINKDELLFQGQKYVSLNKLARDLGISITGLRVRLRRYNARLIKFKQSYVSMNDVMRIFFNIDVNE